MSRRACTAVRILLLAAVLLSPGIAFADEPAEVPEPAAVPAEEPAEVPEPAAVPAEEPAAVPAEEPAPAPSMPAPDDRSLVNGPDGVEPEASPTPSPRPTSEAPPPSPTIASPGVPEPLDVPVARSSAPSRQTAQEPPAEEPPPGAETCHEAGANCGVAPAACSILGGPGDDILVGSPFNDVLCGLGGDDEINGNGGDDVLVGGPGDDKLNGEAGEDCLLAGAGDDEVRTDRRREPVAGERRRRHPRAFVSPDGSCYRAVPKNGRTTFELVAGPVRGPVQTGAFFIALGRLAAAARQGDVDPFGVSLPKRTLFRDGLLRQLLLCPTTVSGRLVYRTRDGRLVARTRFTCTPQSELVRISLSPSVRRRLEVAGRLKVNVRVTIGDDVQSFSITLRVA